MCQDTAEDNVGVLYYQFKLADGPHSRYLGGECTYDMFSEAVEAVASALADDETVCVHCHAGQSRSVAVSIAALARVNEWSYEKAREKVYQAHPNPMPEPTLLSFAQTYVVSDGNSMREYPSLDSSS